MAFVLTALFLLVEVVGGILTGSLALLADAAHMFTDVTALAISLAALKIGRRAPDLRRTYGYQRFEILAAALNALLLFAAAAYILYEAWERYRFPSAIRSLPMLAIAAVGLAVNLIAMKLLSGGRQDSLNVEGAYLEVWSDMLGSLGVIAAAAAIHFTGWYWLDPLVAVAIGLWVLPRTWRLLRKSAHILLEGTPAEVDLGEVERSMLAVSGVLVVHDLHVWSVSSGSHILTAHVVVASDAPKQRVLQTLSAGLRSRFGLAHTTLQIEESACDDLHPRNDSSPR